MAPRGKGEGSIYRDSDGRWRGFLDLGYDRGRRRRKYVTGRTRREVADKLRAAAAARESGALVVTDSRQTVGDWLEFWLESIAASKVRPSTLHSYRGYVRNRIIPALGRHRLDRLQPEHLEEFYRNSLGQGLAPATVLQMHRILSRSLKVAMRRDAAEFRGTWRPWSTRQRSAGPRWCRSPPPRPARSSLPHRRSATPPAGPSHSHSGCARARPSVCTGTTWTSRGAR